MKKTENKGFMMVLGIIICWITGAALYGFARFLYNYFDFKILLYIIGPIVIGFIFFMIVGNIREKKNRQKKVDSLVEELYDKLNN